MCILNIRYQGSAKEIGRAIITLDGKAQIGTLPLLGRSHASVVRSIEPRIICISRYDSRRIIKFNVSSLGLDEIKRN